MTIPPIIVVPGITASALYDEYQLPPEAVWTTLLKRRYDRITLHPEDQRYEFREPARVTPRGPLPLIYEDLVEELREGLSEDQPEPVPVFPFGYDWRMPLSSTEELLANFVEEVIDRTLLMQHYRNDQAFREQPTVSLIGHSMGGLVIAGYIEGREKHRVDKVVTLGTPFRGSYEAVLKVVTGTGEAGDDPGKTRERRTSRMTPALYHLLPDSTSFVASGEDGTEFDLFDLDSWQPNIARSMDRQLADWNVTGRELLGKMLDEARDYRRRVSGLNLGDRGIDSNRWLAIAGANSETRVGLRIVPNEYEKPRFDLRSEERRNDWSKVGEPTRRNTGDGTVPLVSAIPPFLDESRLVCVTPEDFGYWEIRDRVLLEGAGFHAALPNMNMLHRLILRFLLDRGDPYRSTWGRRLPGVDEWKPPLDLRDKDARLT